MGKNQDRKNGQTKIIRRFRIRKPVDKLIRQWAETNIFLEGNPPGQYLMDENNHAYCYHKKIEYGTVCVLVDTLDQEMRVEAWTIDEISCENKAADAVCRLFEMLDSTHGRV